MYIVGYEATIQIDQGDAWVNAVDPRHLTCIAHKECAWNQELLSDSDVVGLRKITPEEASGLMCGYCQKPLTEKQYYSFLGSKGEDN